MPGRLLWAGYVNDDGDVYAKLADETEINDPTRGWITQIPFTTPHFPRGAKPRLVYGYSPATGRRGHTIAAQASAAIYQVNSGTTTFRVTTDTDPYYDDLNITSRAGEKWPRVTTPAPPVP